MLHKKACVRVFLHHSVQEKQLSASKTGEGLGHTMTEAGSAGS